MEWSHVTNTTYGGSGGAGDKINADYGELASIGEHLVELSKLMCATGYSGNDATEDFLDIQGALNISDATKSLQLLSVGLLPATNLRDKAGENLGIIGQAIVDVAALYRDSENAVRAINRSSSASRGAVTLTTTTEGFADAYYEKVEADQAEADRLKDEQEKEDAAKQAEAESMLGTVTSLCPGAAAWYQQTLNDAAIEEAIAYYEDPERGNNPALAAKLREEYEAMKKAREEAAKLGEELGSGDGSSDLGSSELVADLGSGGGSDFGGGSGLGGGSDFGGSGGFDLGGSGIETDWGSSDFASDLLEDNIDAGEYLDAAAELDDITGVGLDGPAAGADAVAGDATDAAVNGLWAQYGPQLSEMAQRYGVQAGLVLGGAAALYATREQTTEAVAHVAEFMTTKCRPAVNDVMEQVRDATKKTHVRLDNARSNVTAAVRGERAGDLIG